MIRSPRRLLPAASFAFTLALACAPLAHAASRWTVAEMSLVPRADAAAAPAWTLTVRSDGSGTYTETAAPGAAPLPITVSPATLDRIRLGEHTARGGRCETHTRNIARTGEKTLKYTTPAGVEACTFNYSDDSNLMSAAAAFEAIADTIQQGHRLQHDLRYDRLGLDADMEQLVAEQKSGSALEIANIAPILQTLVADDQVIDRVRRRAARLLQDAGASVPPGFDASASSDR